MAGLLVSLRRWLLACFYTLVLGLVGLVLVNMLVLEPFIPTTLDHMSLRPNVPRQHCHRCFNTTDRLLLGTAGDICPDNLLLVIIVTSHPANLDARRTIRATWGNLTWYRGHRIKTVFMFGVHEDRNFNNLLKSESEKHGDVVQGDFPDSYKSLTTKSIVALKWATRHCRTARYILKTDDDSFNNPHYFARYLLAEAQDPYYVGGYCFTVWPDRREGSKWYVKPDVYPNAYYPVYCAGPAYVVSQAAAAVLVDVSPNVTYMNMEDVFVTGMCRHAAGLQYYQISGIQVTKTGLSDCDLATWVLNIHQVPPHDMQLLWQRLKRGHQPGACTNRVVAHLTIAALFLLAWALLVRTVLRHSSGRAAIGLTI